MKKIWIDLDNSPHVPLFRPIIAELDNRGVKCVITSRDFAQTEDLLHYWKIPHAKIGKHGGKKKLSKIGNLMVRANQLRGYMKSKKVNLALSHGSRTQLVAAKRLGIRSVLMMDYEYTERVIFNYLSTFLLIPEYIPGQRLEAAHIRISKVIRYPGFKEELYLNSFEPDTGLRERLNIDRDVILVTLRPSAMSGNYHDSLSEAILLAILKKLSRNPGVHTLVVSRTGRDRRFLEKHFPGKINFLGEAVDGLQLIWNSDLFISGGGTMNREAALLGVPTYSIFTGRKPYLDEYLQEKGRLTFIDSLEKVELIDVKKRGISGQFESPNPGLTEKVVDIILSL